MASEFIRHLISVHDQAEYGALHEMSTYAEKAEKVLAIVDAELQEVRTVIEALLDVVITEGAESYSQATCQRARALMERMKTR